MTPFGTTFTKGFSKSTSGETFFPPVVPAVEASRGSQLLAEGMCTYLLNIFQLDFKKPTFALVGILSSAH